MPQTNSWRRWWVTVALTALCGVAQAGLKSLPGHVPAVVARLAPIGRLAATNALSLAIGLPLRHQQGLDELMQQLYNPASTNFHKFLSRREFTARFGPTEQDYAAVKHYASANGLTVSGDYSNRLVLDVRGPVAAVERAFHTTLRIYHHPTEARDFFAPDVEPSVPEEVPVNDLLGLTDYAPPRPMAHPAVKLKSVPLNYNGSGWEGSYQGADFRNAYIPSSAFTGGGQVVALFELDSYYAADISNYEAICGYTNVPLQNVYLDGVSSNTTPGYSGSSNAVIEVSLDIEMAIAMAPGLAAVRVYQGKNQYDVFDQIAVDDVAKQVSSSWYFGYGPSQRFNGTNGSGTLDSIFKQMVTQGQALFQASGDSDAYTGSQAFSSSHGPIPMDSVYLTSVGGTSLTMNGVGASWASETVWNYASAGGSFANVGSGGGISANYPIPSWQTNVSMAVNNGSTVYRNVPDVALVADYVFVLANGITNLEAGTSCAAPLWAGFCALANQLAVMTNGAALGFLNPALYAAGGSSAYPGALHDITTGNNIGANTAGLFDAEPGYDLATGLGTPAGTNLINALVWPPPTFTNQPSGKAVTNGANVTLTATASSTTALGYYWLCNGTNLAAGGNVSGVATNTLAITSATTNSAGNYQLVATNFTGAVTSGVAVLNVGFVPTVSVAPTALTLLAGSNAVFTATAGGSAPLGYRWKKNGTNFAGSGVTGTNTSALTLTGVTTNSAANYTVVVTNLFGSSTSSLATLTVVLPPAIKSSSLTNSTLQCGSNNVTFAVTATGTAPLSYQWSFDGAPVMAATNASFSVTNLHLPNHTVSLQITNLYASLSSNAVLTVQDTLPPVITLNGTNPMYVQLDGTFTDPGATATDLCMGVVGVTVTGSVNPNAVGTNTLRYAATDGNGNTNTATRTVIVRDTTPPTILWSFTNLVLAANSNCYALMPNVTGTNYILATALAGSVTNFQIPTNNAILMLGTNPVVIIVKDSYGNTAYSTNTVVVLDQTPPVITLNGANPMFSELGQPFIDPGAGADDNCAGVVPVTVSGTVNINAVGTNTLVYTATDGNGNTNTATRTVIVRDTTPPTILWSFTNLVLAANANCVAIMPDVTDTNYILVTDLSGVGTISESPTNGSLLALGSNAVVLAVSDIYSNTAYSTNVIVVQGETPPVITLNGSNPMFAELGQPFTDPGATADEACAGVVPVTASGAVNVNVTGTNTLVYTADDGNGNTNTVTRTVIVIAPMPPTILWSFTNLVLAANANCVGTMPDVTGTNYLLATDLWGIGAIAENPTNGSPLALGSNAVVLAVSDIYSNTAYSTNVIVVLDETPPVITLNGSNPLFTELGQPFNDPGATAYDACAGVVPVTASGVVNVNVLGTNTLVYTADDGNGNTNTATRTVIVQDTTPPTILWSFTNLVLVANSNCAATMPDVTGTNDVLATDLSGIGAISESPTNGSPLALGSNVVVLAVSDIYSNTAYSTNVIVVLDETPPVITLNGSNPMFTELGLPFTDPGATAYDACTGMVPVTASGMVNVNIIGTNTVVYTADNGNGNTNTIARTVIVQDTTPPTILWSFTNLVLAANANCVAFMPDVTGTNYILAADISGLGTISENPTNGSWLALGSNVVVLAVSDVYSNTAYSTNVIVVQDETPPVIVVQPQSQTNTAGTSASFSVAATACTPLAFQWLFNQVALPAQTNSTLILGNVGLAAAGSYAVVVAANGGSVTSTVAGLTIYVPPTISGVSAVPSGSVQLNLAGTPGESYIVEAATNLFPPIWIPLATNTLGTNGVWQFTDGQSTNFPQQFYRLMLAP